jgi:vacuolar-type H+-ATPase subunit I/STV1
LSTVAIADDSDPRVIEQRLVALESKPEQKQLVATPVASARKTLERVKNAHAAGDVPFALELGALAKDYAGLAGDILRANELEKELEKVQAELTSVEQKRRRTETLLEETVDQRERTKQVLSRLQAEKAAAIEKPVDDTPASKKKDGKPVAVKRGTPKPATTEAKEAR